MAQLTPPAQPERLEIRSFHVVFALERRLHRIDRWRLPFPYGVPVRAIAYGAGAMLAIVIAGRLPLVGALVGAVPPPLRYAIAPAAIGGALARLRVDGRPAHRYLLARVLHRCSPARRSGVRTAPSPGRRLHIARPCLIAPDSRGPCYAAAHVDGPAELLLRYPARGRQRGSQLTLVQAGSEPLRAPKRVTLAAGQRLILAPGSQEAS